MTGTGMWRAVVGLVMAGALGGCVVNDLPRSAAAPEPTAPPPALAFDGHYVGSVQFVSMASGGDPSECTADPHMSLQVAGGSFVYAQPHPGLEGTTPGLTHQVTTMTYKGTVGADGAVAAENVLGGGRIVGQVSGAHMTGHIYGALCTYSFSADRV